MNKLKIAAAVICAGLLLAGCGDAEPISHNGSESETRAKSQDITEASEVKSNKEETDFVINPLTGEGGFNEKAVGKRPVAVMVSNIKAALPQYGIDEADIIYELPVEGGITRLMAVYADYTNVPDVCSVRSCRYYYPILAYGMDAFYCHWGSDKTIALETLNYLGIDRFDGNENSLGYGTVFERDEYRMQYYDTEHTGYLMGANLAEAIEDMGYRTEINEENEGTAFNFLSPNETKTPKGEECLEAELNFSGDYYSTFEYDLEEQVYYKYHSGSPHCDGVSGQQLSFTNIFVLETSIYQMGDSELLDIDLTGGDGYYLSMGACEPITWSKDSYGEPILVFNEEGEELEVNTGKSYIGFIEADSVSLNEE